MNESLRIEPPVRSGTVLQLREKTEIGGYTIDSDIPILVDPTQESLGMVRARKIIS